MSYPRNSAHHRPAQRVYQQADQWRTFARVMAGIGGFVGFIAAVNGSRDFYGDFDGGAFMISILMVAAGIAVGLMPYFMLARILEGVGSVIEQGVAVKNERDQLRTELAEQAAAAAPPAAEPAAAAAAAVGGLSVGAGRVLAVISALGDAAYSQIAEQLGIDTAEVDVHIYELLGVGLVERQPGGTYRSVERR